MTIKINKTLARNAKAHGNDVRQIKKSLNWLGYYTPYEKTGLSDYPDAELFQSILQFQKDNDLHPNGKIHSQ